MFAMQGDCSQNADYVHVEVHGPRWEKREWNFYYVGEKMIQLDLY